MTIKGGSCGGSCWSPGTGGQGGGGRLGASAYPSAKVDHSLIGKSHGVYIANTLKLNNALKGGKKGRGRGKRGRSRDRSRGRTRGSKRGGNLVSILNQAALPGSLWLAQNKSFKGKNFRSIKNDTRKRWRNFTKNSRS